MTFVISGRLSQTMKKPEQLFFIFFIFFYSCVSGQKDNSAVENNDVAYEAVVESDYLSQLEQELIGVWVNSSMKVWVNGYNNSDTSFIVDINEDTWDMKMNVQPIITTIRNDGTYSSEIRNSLDQVTYTPEGTWMLDGDSLIMEDQRAVYKYQIFIDGDIAEFNSLLDWDQDGKADDEYKGVQRKRN
jgi:hypothetical protein